MNSGPTPPRPDDEARDPLLTALQQRLHDYGQAPAPGAWAAIRQQLAPRPWWRRPRRLLPLLALLLGLVVVSTLTVQQKQLRLGNLTAKRAEQKTQGTLHKQRPATNASAHQDSPSQQESSTVVSSGSSAVTPSATAALDSNATTAITMAATPVASTATTPRSTQATTLARRQLAGVAHSSKAATGSSENNPTTGVATRARVALPTRTNSAASPHSSAVRGTLLSSSDKQRTTHEHLISNKFASRIHRARRPSASLARGKSSAPSWSREQPLAATSSANRDPRSPRRTKARETSQHTQQPLAHLLPSAGRRRGVTAATRVAQARRAQTEAASAAEGLATVGHQPNASDSLALKPVALGLPPALALPALLAQPDSAEPRPRARRWSLLVLAGPTLSYRTLGSAPTLAAQHPDFARLERPALGLGAQVQVRRVLSGRWALAAGLGYHEYATRLALSIIDSSSRSPRSVHQRDVYRVLTLPVQLSYALSAPRGRLTWALLVGAEPSWYQGGRSTEGSDCGCQQQVYPADSAKTSPYRPLTLAFSLGLDLRYRLGGSASRWQWVVQPTARYVATPFVRNEAVGFTRRQPWSLGLLTGISWDFR
jgi:hypothetical protein